eukprot:scaffold25842_cov198-Amphora_coffeaeformis.AAC.29
MGQRLSRPLPDRPGMTGRRGRKRSALQKGDEGATTATTTPSRRQLLRRNSSYDRSMAGSLNSVNLSRQLEEAEALDQARAAAAAAAANQPVMRKKKRKKRAQVADEATATTQNTEKMTSRTVLSVSRDDAPGHQPPKMYHRVRNAPTQSPPTTTHSQGLAPPRRRKRGSPGERPTNPSPKRNIKHGVNEERRLPTKTAVPASQRKAGSSSPRERVKKRPVKKKQTLTSNHHRGEDEERDELEAEIDRLRLDLAMMMQFEQQQAFDDLHIPTTPTGTPYDSPLSVKEAVAPDMESLRRELVKLREETSRRSLVSTSSALRRSDDRIPVASLGQTGQVASVKNLVSGSRTSSKRNLVRRTSSSSTRLSTDGKIFKAQAQMLRSANEFLRESVESLEQDNVFLSNNYEAMLQNEETLRAEVDQLRLRLRYDAARHKSEKYQLHMDLKALTRNRNVLLRHLGDLLASLREALESTSGGEQQDLRSRIENLANVYSEKEIGMEMKEEG